jgi:hypothetical protein
MVKHRRGRPHLCRCIDENDEEGGRPWRSKIGPRNSRNSATNSPDESSCEKSCLTRLREAIERIALFVESRRERVEDRLSVTLR